jgi:hypothetical protein
MKIHDRLELAAIIVVVVARRLEINNQQPGRQGEN